ncbi:CidA/LrgA family protein [Aquincola tertiaricarbonis]|uniref:CidA/LrgA family protein n=1 Tax=Aquincola tertiaricarbonis TaxID=391953 RepID=A0ABY4S6X0_AQUTE|nr:CidA/LrgA family protein [Aquincola tertiaricarbonis]URI09151.1 CidA/LrgA family protein [Aquincola tertiaricarbonis]
MIQAFAVLLVLQLVGELLVQSLGLPLPGPLVGMLLLLAGLVWRGGVPEPLRKLGDVLLQNMMLLFIPAVAGVMMLFERVAQEWLPFFVACIGGAAITLVVTALVLQALLKRRPPDLDTPAPPAPTEPRA